MKKYLVSFFVAMLFLGSYITLPQVGYTEPDVFFYFKHLPPLYHISVIVSIIVAIFSKEKFNRIFAAIVFCLLIILTPSILLINPWNLDSYAFVSEAVYIKRNGWMSDVGYILDTPALSLTFGPYLLITGMDPFLFQKMFGGLNAVILLLVVYLIAMKMKIKEKSLVIACLCFISIMWPNTFHVNRQNFSLVYYLTSWFLLAHLILERKDRRFLLLFTIQIFLMVISHPATPVFFLANLILVAAIGRILGVLRSSGLKLLGYASLKRVIQISLTK